MASPAFNLLILLELAVAGLVVSQGCCGGRPALEGGFLARYAAMFASIYFGGCSSG